jgi:hypothetical protein
LIGPLLQEAVDKVTEATTSFTKDVLTSLDGGTSQAESIVQNYTAQANAVNDAAKGPLQSLLQSVTDKIKAIVDNNKQYAQNSTMCLLGQKENAESIVQKTGRTTSEECRRLGYKNPVRTSQETHDLSTTESSQLMLCKS